MSSSRVPDHLHRPAHLFGQNCSLRAVIGLRLAPKSPAEQGHVANYILPLRSQLLRDDVLDSLRILRRRPQCRFSHALISRGAPSLNSKRGRSGHCGRRRRHPQAVQDSSRKGAGDRKGRCNLPRDPARPGIGRKSKARLLRRRLQFCPKRWAGGEGGMDPGRLTSKFDYYNASQPCT